MPTTSAESLRQLQQVGDAKAEVLYVTSSVFPFDFFPTKIVISKTKIDIIYQIFFYSKEFTSIFYQDIARVEVTTSLFFSTLMIFGKINNILLAEVHYLPTRQALEAQSMIQGILVSLNEQINVQHIPPDRLRKEVKKVGKSMG